MNAKKTNILRIAVPTPLRQPFDYLPPAGCEVSKLVPGIRIQIPFQHRQLVGVLLEVLNEAPPATYKLRQAIELIDNIPVIPTDLLELCQWAAEYYHHPVGEVLGHCLTCPAAPG